jgi:hypothetical protein
VLSCFETREQDRQTNEKNADAGVDDKIIHIQLLFQNRSCKEDV